jgi:uncharacterized membrane protein YgdD (TMEM256/DUF423 family)
MRQLVPHFDGVLVGLAGASAVLLGAFGAHALRATLDASHYELWRTAVEYHFWHALALVAAVLCSRRKASRVAMLLFTFGIAMFSGSLYALALGATRWVGIVTPIGGLAFVAGWVALGFAVHAQRDRMTL